MYTIVPLSCRQTALLPCGGASPGCRLWRCSPAPRARRRRARPWPQSRRCRRRRRRLARVPAHARPGPARADPPRASPPEGAPDARGRPAAQQLHRPERHRPDPGRQDARIAAAGPSRVYVSLHFNGGPASLRGTETYYNPERAPEAAPPTAPLPTLLSSTSWPRWQTRSATPPRSRHEVRPGGRQVVRPLLRPARPRPERAGRKPVPVERQRGRRCCVTMPRSTRSPTAALRASSSISPPAAAGRD